MNIKNTAKANLIAAELGEKSVNHLIKVVLNAHRQSELQNPDLNKNGMVDLR